MPVDNSTAGRAGTIPQRQLESQQDRHSCPFYGPLATCSKADLQYKSHDNEHSAILHDCILVATAKTLRSQLQLQQPYKTATTKSLLAHQCSHPLHPVRLAQAEHCTLAWPLGCSGWCMPMQRHSHQVMWLSQHALTSQWFCKTVLGSLQCKRVLKCKRVLPHSVIYTSHDHHHSHQDGSILQAVYRLS